MKHDMKIFRQGIGWLSLSLALLLLCGAAHSVSAQTEGSGEAGKKASRPASKEAVKDASQQDAQPRAATAASGVSRDPFNKYHPVIRRKQPKSVPVPVAPPSIQARIESYKEAKRVAMNMQRPAPKPTTALLLTEMQVIGIFRTPRGYAAMVEATPIKLSYTIYPGERFFDGQLVAIEEDRLVFRHETRWTDGHLARDVQMKPLRQPNTVADPLTAAAKTAATGAAATGAAPSPQPAAKAEDAPAPEKQ